MFIGCGVKLYESVLISYRTSSKHNSSMSYYLYDWDACAVRVCDAVEQKFYFLSVEIQSKVTVVT